MTGRRNNRSIRGMDTQTPAKLLTTRQMAELVGINHATLTKWARGGRVPRIVIGPKTIRYDPVEVIGKLKRLSKRWQQLNPLAVLVPKKIEKPPPPTPPTPRPAVPTRKSET